MSTDPIRSIAPLIVCVMALLGYGMFGELSESALQCALLGPSTLLAEPCRRY